MIFEVQKRGKCDLLQWERRDPGPHGNVDFLWRKATQKKIKRYSCLFLRRYFVEHSYHDNGVLNHILDDGKLVNHSHTPNAGAGVYDYDYNNPTYMPNPDLCLGLEPLSTYALRDIKKGEEVSTNYEKFGTIVHPCKSLLLGAIVLIGMKYGI